MPAWLSVNPVNTPNAYSGISLEMSPLKTTIRTPAIDGEEDDAVGEHQAVAAVEELPGQEAVPGDDRRQPREVGVGGVGGEDQDRERARSWSARTSRPCRRRCTRPSGRARCRRSRRGTAGGARPAPRRRGSTTPRMPPIHTSVRRGVLALRLAGTPARRWTPPRRPTAPRRPTRTPASSMIQRRAPCCASASCAASSTGLSSGIGAEVLDEHAVAADDDQQDEHQRCRSTSAPANAAPDSFDATQVGHRHQRRRRAGRRARVHLVSKPVAVRIASTPPATLTATVRM